MGENLNPQQIFDYLTNDFEVAWDAVASADTGDRGRGNFSFSLLATILLEWTCRFCKSDPSGQALSDLSEALFKIDRRYFVTVSPKTMRSKDFDLPRKADQEGESILALIFDLIRNGQAHQYQQILVTLADGIDLQVSLAGAAKGHFLKDVESARKYHLQIVIGQNGIWIRVDPALLFMDIRNSILASSLLDRGLEFENLTRTASRHVSYNLDSKALIEQCIEGGLVVEYVS